MSATLKLPQEKANVRSRPVAADRSLCYDHEDDDLPLVFRKPCWQLYATLISTLITPLLYRVYLILVTIGWALLSNGTSGAYTNPYVATLVGVAKCPAVDLSWTGLLPCDPSWRGSAVAVVVLSFFIVSFYSLAIIWILRYKRRRTLVIKIITKRQPLCEAPHGCLQKWRNVIGYGRKFVLSPALSVCLLVMLQLLLIRAGDVELNPGPLVPITLKDLAEVYEKVYSARPKWYNLGLALVLDSSTLDSIRIKFREDPSECLRELLKTRLKFENKLTWRELIKALRNPTVEESKLADQLEEVYDPQETCAKETTGEQAEKRCFESQDIAVTTTVVPIQQPLPSIQTYQTYLKGVYSVKQLPVDEKYPIDCVKHFVNLECADARKHLTRREAEEFVSHSVYGNIGYIKRERITMEQVASKQHGCYPKLVLVKGAPGVGKTTFSWELCRRWSTGELLNDYSLVVLLRLRDENVQEAEIVSDLFQCEDDRLSMSIADDLKSVQGKGVLFILEGLDELPGDVRVDQKSIFMKLVMGFLFPASTVMVTTRPWAASDLPHACKSRIDQHIDILGFNKKQIDEYIDHMIKDGVPEGLRTYVSANPHISSAMYNPLHARIVVEVYRECNEEKNSIFPNTTTELYTAYSAIIIHRYLADHPADEPWSGEISTLPSSIEPHFNNLCKVAYQGIVNEEQQLVFSKSDIPDGSTTLGFMNSVQPLYRTVTKATSPSYNFLHFTLQEYLAAVYIWKNQTPQQHLILFETKNRNGTYRMIFTFLAGLTQFKDKYTRCVLPVPFHESKKLFGISCDFIKAVSFNRYSDQHIMWLYESQSFKPCIGDGICLFRLDCSLYSSDLVDLSSPIYAFAVGYCIASSKSGLFLNIEGTSLSQDQCAMLVAGARHNSSSVKLKYLTLNGIPYDSSTLDVLPRICDTECVEYFKLSFYSYDESIPTSLLGLLRTFLNLKEVELCELHPDKNRENVVSMFKILGSKPFLKMLSYTLASTADFDILSDLIMNSSSLTTLVVKIPVSGNKTISFGFNIDKLKQHHGQDNPILKSSVFRLDKVSKKMITGIVKYFSHSLELLNLCGYELSNKVMKSLANSITFCSSLTDIHITISDVCRGHVHATSGVCSMAEALSKLKSIEVLHVTDYSQSFYVLLSRLDRCPSLRDLVLKGVVAKQDAEALASVLHNSQSLQSLELHLMDTMKEGDLDLIMSALEINSSLKTFRIARNYPSVCQVIGRSVAKVFASNTTLEVFELEFSCLSKDVDLIAQALGSNTTLKTLRMQWSASLVKDEVEAVGMVITTNTSIEVLHVYIEWTDLSFWSVDFSPIIKALTANNTLLELGLPDIVKDIIVTNHTEYYVTNRYRIRFLDYT